MPITNPNIAKSFIDLVTPRQLVAIRAIARSRGAYHDDLCLEWGGCHSEELSRLAASRFIAWMKGEV